MSVAINIHHAKKAFGSNTIIPDLNLSINDGEFFTLLGPSGCGKTTLLRMIAGFNSIEGGDFYFNDTRINDLDPAKRNIGMVFQNYAIFPHLSVRKNVEFGLKNKKIPPPNIREVADEYLRLVQIESLATRMPDRLSGGQQQRVALARALCISPDVLLMDEPLSNLDAKLRVEMRLVIKEIQHNVGITTVYVTHDQEEAMAISDRIAIMNQGVIQQISTPQSIYHRPYNQFVATFIGLSNIFDVSIMAQDGAAKLHFQGQSFTIPNLQDKYIGELEAKLSVRPEEWVIAQVPAEGSIPVRIEDSIFLGLNTHYFVRFQDDSAAQIVSESDQDSALSKGATAFLNLKTSKVNLFTSDGSVNMLKGVQNDNE